MRKDMTEQSFEAIFENLVQQSGDPEISKGLLEITQKYFSWEQLEETFYELYTEVFTSQELSDIVSFYQSPAGRIYAEKQTELAIRSTKATQDIVMRNQEALMKDIQELMAKRMHHHEPDTTH